WAGSIVSHQGPAATAVEMLQELKFQLSTAILTILTLAAGVAAVINFEQIHRFRLPEDGAIWVDRQGAVVARDMARDSSAAKAGLRKGDRLLKINGSPVEKAVHVTQILVGVGAWNWAEYVVNRGGVEFRSRVLISEVPLERAVSYQCAVGLAYLIIGLFVYFRRGSAHKARHFYVLCLLSFVFFSFHYTGQLNNFDKVIY